MAVPAALNKVPVKTFEGSYKARDGRWKKLLDAHGEYFEDY